MNPVHIPTLDLNDPCRDVSTYASYLKCPGIESSAWRQKSLITPGNTSSKTTGPSGSAKLQVVNDLSLGQCGSVYGGQSGTGTSFSPCTSVFPCRYHCTGAARSLADAVPMLHNPRNRLHR